MLILHGARLVWISTLEMVLASEPRLKVVANTEEAMSDEDVACLSLV